MGKIVGMGAIPKKADSDGAVKKENALLKKANEKLVKENEELLAKVDEVSAYAENADNEIAELAAQLAALSVAQKREQGDDDACPTPTIDTTAKPT